ncbi:Putative flippase GtrA (transmembrane translocase of bactoprenol-linked glucose) [Marinobacter sp. es.048]|uniref:GtrA family protein n=1 Tax=Marinobacter sp. es.048 TaxID=1761795 RepID=UPI000B590B25|nr:GtrA family protein [Marinobacter sp. es.048]SNC60497.1 Putative flippase GtrA (transmembrane translocase of bactoprenol-linked glucose) [Marinobacter sp. es.048]
MRVPILRSTGWGRLPRFLLAGGAATLLHWLTMLVLIGWGLTAVLATATGATVGLLTNYVGQHRYAFCSGLPHRVAFPRYLTGAALGWTLNLMGFSLLLVAGLSTAPSQMITTGLVAFANYFFARRFVFHEEPTINSQ